MKFLLKFASDPDWEEEITINSIEDLKKIQDEQHYRLIVDFGSALTPKDGTPIIIVYDYWME